MSLLRNGFLKAVGLAGIALMASGGMAYAAPDDYASLTDQFNGGERVGGRYTSLVAAATSIEPVTAMVLGGSAVAYSLYHYHSK